MAIEPDEPRAREAKPLDLSLLSIAELEARIAAHEAEIARMRAAIRSKEAQKSAADSFFRKDA